MKKLRQSKSQDSNADRTQSYCHPINKMRIFSPPHPGVFLKEEIRDALGLSITGAARILGVTRAALSRLAGGKTSLTQDIALRFEKAFGVRMDTLLRMQTPCDIAKTGKTASNIKFESFEARPQ